MAWDEEYDVVVVGSGGGGMLSALAAHDAGLSAVVLEKASKFGGTTALSGGAIWVPNNPTLKKLGHDDSREPVGSRRTSTTAPRPWSSSSAAGGRASPG